MISTSNEQAAWVWSEITSMISNQNCTTQSAITTKLHLFEAAKFSCLIQYFLNCKNILLIQYIELVCKKLQIKVVFHLPAIWLISLNKLWNLIHWCVLIKLSHWLRKRCNLEHEMVQFVNKSHCWVPIRLQGSQVISKWM